MNLSWIQGFECALRAGGTRSGAARSKRGAARSMPYRLVSPDRKLYLVDNEHDLKAVGKLYGLTSPQIRNVRQLLGWTGVGNHSGDRNDRTERKEAENFQLLSQIHWLKRDDASELVPVVGKPPHIWKSAVTSHPDMNLPTSLCSTC